MSSPISGFRRLVVIAVALIAGSSLSLFVASVNSPLVSRNKSPRNLLQHPLHPHHFLAAGVSISLSPIQLVLRSICDRRVWIRPLLGGSAPCDCLRSPLLPDCVTHCHRHRLPVTAIPDPGASFFNTAALSLVPSQSSCLPMGSRCKLLHLPPVMIQPHL
jgi:hypothetical protein